MSSSGEEVKLDDIINDESVQNESVQSKEAKSFRWDNDHVRRLATYVSSNLAPGDLDPYDMVNIDWDDVEEAVGVDEEKCQHKWKLLMNSVRTYRTMGEIVLDILSENAKSDVSKKNKAIKQASKQVQEKAKAESSMTNHPKTMTNHPKRKKRKINPAHPKRPPVSGYSVFCRKMMSSVQNEAKGAIQAMYILSQRWKEIPEREQQVYKEECLKQREAYYESVKEYAAKHPDDAEIQEILAEETSRKSKIPRKSTKVKKDVKDPENSTLHEETMDDTMLSNDSTSILESPRKSPKKKKRHVQEDSQDSSPSKKKKKLKKEKVFTAVEMFIEAKIDGYRLDHQEMEEDEIREKLAKKFNKLSDIKKEKYKRKAEERNP